MVSDMGRFLTYSSTLRFMVFAAGRGERPLLHCRCHYSHKTLLIMAVQTLTIDQQLVSARPGETILDAAKDAGISIPTLCYLEGVSNVGACRLCLVEVVGTSKLLPACATSAEEGMVILTQSERLQSYRRTVLELLFAEGNHVCSVCVANGNCELQDLAVEMGMDHVSLAYQFPDRAIDI